MNILKKINNAFEYYSNALKSSSELSKKIKKSQISICFDILKSRIKYGSSIEDYLSLEFYKKSNWEKQQYLTASKNWYTIYNLIPKDKVDIFNNKTLFNEFYKNYLGREWCIINNIDDLLNFLEKYEKIILKPNTGSEGKGIILINKSENDKINVVRNNLQNGDTYIAEELIVQHDLMQTLNDKCVNTIRVETVVDKYGKAHITNTVVIIGTNGGITNNAHNGGIMCNLDIDKGFITGGARNPEGVNVKIHPDNNLVLPGFQIPHWNEVKMLAIKLAEMIPQARYIGWDIAITPDGPIVIEGNTRPGQCTQACDMVGRWPLIKSYL